jgi:hypothetical protein
MKPIYIILFAVITTTILTTLFSQRQNVSASQKRMLRIAVAVGVVALGGVALLLFIRT